MEELPAITIESARDEGVYVCVPQEHSAEFVEFLEEGRENCLVNPRRLSHLRRHGTDLVLFLHHSVEEVGERLSEYGFSVQSE